MARGVQHCPWLMQADGFSKSYNMYQYVKLQFNKSKSSPILAFFFIQQFFFSKQTAVALISRRPFGKVHPGGLVALLSCSNDVETFEMPMFSDVFQKKTNEAVQCHIMDLKKCSLSLYIYIFFFLYTC